MRGQCGLCPRLCELALGRACRVLTLDSITVMVRWWLCVHLRARQALDPQYTAAHLQKVAPAAEHQQNSMRLMLWLVRARCWVGFKHWRELASESDYCWFEVLFSFFETGSLRVALAVLEFIQISDCLCLPNAGIKGVHHHAGQFVVFFEGRSYCTAQAGFKLTIFPPGLPSAGIMLWAITLSCEGLDSWFCTWWGLL